MNTIIHRTLTFKPSMHKAIRAHARKHGCTTYGEAARDLIRIGLKHAQKHATKTKSITQRRPHQQRSGALK